MTRTAEALAPDRIDRGLKLWRERRDEIRSVSGGRWWVPSGSGSGAYLVDLERKVCKCDDYRFNILAGKELCKHGWAAIFEMMSGATR